MIGAQFIEERARQIAERHDEIEEQLDEDPSYTEDEIEEMIPEYEDIEEMILEEEANEFSFTGDEDNFLDPDSIAMLAKVGKAGIEKYKEKRFAQGKKAFGRTKAQDAAIKAKKALAEQGLDTGDPLTDAMRAAKEKLVQEKTTETVKEYTPYIIGGTILLVVVGVAIYMSNKSK